jgi:hypothetical protein
LKTSSKEYTVWSLLFLRLEVLAVEKPPDVPGLFEFDVGLPFADIGANVVELFNDLVIAPSSLDDVNLETCDFQSVDHSIYGFYEVKSVPVPVMTALPKSEKFPGQIDSCCETAIFP